MTNPFTTQAAATPQQGAASPNNPFQQQPQQAAQPQQAQPAYFGGQPPAQQGAPDWMPQQQAQPSAFTQQVAPEVAQVGAQQAQQYAQAGYPGAAQAFAPQQGYAPMPTQQAPAPQQYAPQVPQQQPAPASPPWGQQAPAAQPAPWGAPGQGADPFSTPSAGTAGPRPAIRDLEGRLVLIKVTERNTMRDKYQAKPGDPQEPANVCDVAVLDGGEVIMSPKMNDPQGVPTKFGDAPCVIDGLIIQQKGVMNRTKAALTLGRIVRAPLPDLKKRPDWPAAPEGTPDSAVLAYWLQQDPNRAHQFKNMMFWSVEAFTEADAQTARDFLAKNPTFLN